MNQHTDSHDENTTSPTNNVGVNTIGASLGATSNVDLRNMSRLKINTPPWLNSTIEANPNIKNTL